MHRCKHPRNWTQPKKTTLSHYNSTSHRWRKNLRWLYLPPPWSMTLDSKRLFRRIVTIRLFKCSQHRLRLLRLRQLTLNEHWLLLIWKIVSNRKNLKTLPSRLSVNFMDRLQIWGYVKEIIFSKNLWYVTNHGNISLIMVWVQWQFSWK